MCDGRLSLARLCALQGRYHQASEWFEKACEVLEEQGARALLAIAEFDEARMFLTRSRRSDRKRA